MPSVSKFIRFLERRERPYIRPSLELTQVDSIDTIASDATAPNLPGPGRNLGRLYDTAGTWIEGYLNRRAEPGASDIVINNAAYAERQDVRSSLELSRVKSIDTIASDATAPNLPGPGRNLGRLYDAIGGWIEGYLNRRAGPGIVAVVKNIRDLRNFEDHDYGFNILVNPTVPTGKERSTLKKLCRWLLKYCG